MVGVLCRIPLVAQWGPGIIRVPAKCDLRESIIDCQHFAILGRGSDIRRMSMQGTVCYP